MNKLSLKEIQDIEFNMLIKFDDVCSKNNLNYSICGGTLLGAVRHKGFIPWDDDIDIVMPRPDYYKLQKNADEWLPSNLIFTNPHNDEGAFNAYGKIQNLDTTLIEFPDSKIIKTHIYIDIFPVDGLPTDRIKQERHRKKLYRRMMMLYFFRIAKYKVNESNGILKSCFWKFIKICDKAIPNEFLVNHIEKVALKYNYYDSKYVGVIVAGYGAKEIMPRLIYGMNNKIEFNGKLFKCFDNWDFYLTSIYGNYMEIPPVEKQFHHDMLCYRNDNV